MALMLQAPLSRKGDGPPLILVVDEHLDLSGHEKTLDPPPLRKWAEEGYTVAQVSSTDADTAETLGHKLRAAVGELRAQPSCEWKGKVGLISIWALP